MGKMMLRPHSRDNGVTFSFPPLWPQGGGVMRHLKFVQVTYAYIRHLVCGYFQVLFSTTINRQTVKSMCQIYEDKLCVGCSQCSWIFRVSVWGLCHTVRHCDSRELELKTNRKRNERYLRRIDTCSVASAGRVKYARKLTWRFLRNKLKTELTKTKK